MKMVRIISTPAGEAPLWVREAWVGLEMPLAKRPEEVSVTEGVLGGPPDPENINGYPIITSLALGALTQKNAGAVQWWVNLFSRSSRGMPKYLVFGKKFCELFDYTGPVNADEIALST